MLVQVGSTNVTTYFHLRLAADGTDATGLTITNIDLQYVRSGAAPAAKVDATALAATDSAHGDNQAIEIDATDQPGVYRVDWPDAAFAAGVPFVYLTVKCATVFTETIAVQLVGCDPASATRGFAGTALPAAAADAAGGLPISDAGGLDLDAQLGTKINDILTDTGTTLDGKIDTIDGIVDAIVADSNELQTDWANGGRLDLILDARASQTSVDDVPTNAELATALGTADDAVLTQVALVKAKTDLIPGTQDGLTFAQAMMLMAAVLLGKASGLGTTTAVYRSPDDGEDRVTATVDADGNRSAVTLNTA